MRRSVSLLVLAVTSMVAIAFVLPLGLLVRRQASDRGIALAQRDARAVASALAVAEALSGGTAADVAATVIAISADRSDSTLFLPDGSTVGVPATRDGVVETAAGGVALTARGEGGVEVLIPVAGPDGTTVVRTFVPDELLQRGVIASWFALGALGLLLVGAAVALADRLGRSSVEPVHQLAAAARRMGDGDLEARVDPAGPREVQNMGQAFNELAERLESLLAAERESVADLSHRLRTPLTALRLGVEQLEPGDLRTRLVEDVDRMGRQVDAIIREARQSPEQRHHTDLVRVVAERFDFWRVLAEDQGRDAELSLPGTAQPVAMGAAAASDMVEVLLENVFAHTEPGTPFRVSVERTQERLVLRVEDGGHGFPDGFVPSRGDSRGDSTGLGLDIVARAAASHGGGVTIGRSPLGGASVEVSLSPR